MKWNSHSLARRAAIAAAMLLPLLAGAAAVQAADPPLRVLVFGGSGGLGSEVVGDLIADGRNVTVFVRPTSDRRRLAGMPVTYIEGDVLVEADVQRALQSQRFDAVVDALGRSEADIEFFSISGRLISKWATATGVKQLILHSSVGVGESRKAYPQNRFGSMAALFRAKGEGEQAVIDSGIPYTIIRNAVLRNLRPGAPDNAKLYEDQGTFGTVSRRGLGRLTAGCIGTNACSNKIYHAIDEGMSGPQ